MTASVVDISTRLAASLAAPVPAPPPGVYENVPIEVYHSWDAASNSRLAKLKRSPAHLLAYLKEPTDTEALKMGRAIHCAILEPDLFTTKYVTAGQCTATKKDNSQCTNDGKVLDPTLGWRCGVHGPKGVQRGPLVLTPERFAACLGVRDAVHRHSIAGGLFRGEGRNELSFVWVDPETGVVCKARHDRHSGLLAGGVIADLKKTTDARPDAFMRAVWDYSYYVQAGFYTMGADAHDAPWRHFGFLAVEDDPPYGVYFHRLAEGAIDAGAEESRRLLRTYAECQTRGEWPCYPEQVYDLTLPDWAWAKLEAQQENV